MSFYYNAAASYAEPNYRMGQKCMTKIFVRIFAKYD